MWTKYCPLNMYQCEVYCVYSELYCEVYCVWSELNCLLINSLHPPPMMNATDRVHSIINCFPSFRVSSSSPENNKRRQRKHGMLRALRGSSKQRSLCKVELRWWRIRFEVYSGIEIKSISREHDRITMKFFAIQAELNRITPTFSHGLCYFCLWQLGFEYSLWY